MTRPTLTEELWAAIEGLYGEILAHPRPDLVKTAYRA